MKLIRHHWELEVYQLAVEAAMRFFELSKTFPKDETYSLTDQGRRSSRAVPGAIAEAWRRRKYEAIFVNKLSEGEGEAAETQVWVQFAVRCGYVGRKNGQDLHLTYDRIIGKLTNMGNHPEKWILRKSSADMT